MVSLTRVGAFTLDWGESLRWDDRRQRLYFVDCATQTLHWLDDGCVLGSGKIARFTAAGLDRVVETPMANPSDVTFGGADLDRLFVTSIAMNL